MSEYIWVGLDVHVESITAAILEGESDNAEVLKLSGDLHKIRRLFLRLSKGGRFVPVTRPLEQALHCTGV